MRNACSTLNDVKKKACLTLAFLLIFCAGVYSQNQRLADSLELVYSSGNFEEEDRLKILKGLAANHTDPQNQLSYSTKLIQLAQELDSIYYEYNGLLQKGNALRLKSDLPQALECYFEAAKLAGEEKLIRELGVVNVSIADVYSIMGNRTNAINYYHNAIDILREENDSIGFGSALENLGDEYLNASKPDSALIILKESGEIFRALNFEIGIAYNRGNTGIAYALQGRDDLADANMNEATAILEKLEDYYPISVYMTYMSDIYLKRNDWNTALSYSQRSLELAQKYGLKDQISNAYLQISELYEQAGNPKEAYQYYKNYILYRDSVKNIESIQQMADIRTDYEVNRKQIEIDLLNQQKRNQQIIVLATITAMVLIGLLAFGLYRRNKFIQKTNSIIEKEKNRSDELLLNILPSTTAEELKQYGSAKAKNYEMVTVLFTDFKEFTQHSERLSPEELVAEIDHCFKTFDLIIEQNNVEKIKTVGDAYLAAAGLPTANISNPADAVKAALAIRDFMLAYKSKREADGREAFEIRIGLHTGPVVAGIVGIRKFAYDIWGDTVNLASRMESSCEVGKVNISQSTYDYLKERAEFKFIPRGKIKAKNKGEIEMYFVENT